MDLEPCAQLTSTLSTDCLVTEHMISVLTQRCVMKPGGAHSEGQDVVANCHLADPSTHLTVPLTPADCDGVFITQRACGISRCALLTGLDCSVYSLLFSVCSFLCGYFPWSIVGPLFMFLALIILMRGIIHSDEDTCE